jgi:hypothetical protein
MTFSTSEKAEVEAMRHAAFEFKREQILVWSEPETSSISDGPSLNFAYSEENISEGVTKTYSPVSTAIWATVQPANLMKESEVIGQIGEARFIKSKNLTKINIESSNLDLVSKSESISLNGKHYVIVAGPTRRKILGAEYYDFWIDIEA